MLSKIKKLQCLQYKFCQPSWWQNQWIVPHYWNCSAISFLNSTFPCKVTRFQEQGLSRVVWLLACFKRTVKEVHAFPQSTFHARASIGLLNRGRLFLSWTSATCVTVPAHYGFSNIQSQLSGCGHASEAEQFYEAHAYSTPAVGI